MSNGKCRQNKRVKDGFPDQILIVLPSPSKREVFDNPINRSLHITALGYFPKAAYHYRDRKAGIRQYILIYCTAGSGFIYINDLKYQLQSDEFMIIPQHTPHRYMSSDTAPWTIYWAHFNGDLAEHLYTRSLLNGKQAIRKAAPDQSRIKLFMDMCNKLSCWYTPLELEGINFQLLNFITSLIYHKTTHTDNLHSDFIKRSIIFMKENINKKYGVKQLAMQQGVSVSHYAARFKQKMSTSPIQYFNQLKIQKASQYLYSTNRSIKSICFELGFDDQYYFSRLFSKVNGISPSKYKQTNK